MEILILIMSICCFISCLFFLISKMAGAFILQFMFRIISFFGTISPVIYWLKLLQII